jgi:hypothetical protein
MDSAQSERHRQPGEHRAPSEIRLVQQAGERIAAHGLGLKHTRR